MDIEYSCFEMLGEYKKLVSTMADESEKSECYAAIRDIEPIAAAELHETSMEMIEGIRQNLICERIKTFGELIDYILFLGQLSMGNLHRIEYITEMMRGADMSIIKGVTCHGHNIRLFIDSLPRNADDVAKLVIEYGASSREEVVGYEIDRDEKKAKIIIDFMREYFNMLAN
jgi:hypothetical protein